VGGEFYQALGKRDTCDDHSLHLGPYMALAFVGPMCSLNQNVCSITPTIHQSSPASWTPYTHLNQNYEIRHGAARDLLLSIIALSERPYEVRQGAARNFYLT